MLHGALQTLSLGLSVVYRKWKRYVSSQRNVLAALNSEGFAGVGDGGFYLGLILDQ